MAGKKIDPNRPRKRCSRCREEKARSEFSRNRRKTDGLTAYCRVCDAARMSATEVRQGEVSDQRAAAEDARVIAEAEARAARLASDYDALRPEDFDVTVANDGKVNKSWAREKRQDYSRQMGEYARGLRAAGMAQARGEGDVLGNMQAESGTYVAKVAEQERRFGNRRVARSITLAAAQEQLALRHFQVAARQCLAGKIQPIGYAKKPSSAPIKRTVCLLLSDLHLGAELHSLDEPVPFRATEEARRLEYIMRQAIDYKPQYRAHSDLLLILNGDVIEGQLGHDLRDGAPLTEQKVVFWRYMSRMVGEFSAAFPRVRVVCQPGNHGRDKVRHPGRATSRKWDGHEWELYYGLSQMASSLRNVEWQLDFRSASKVDLYGSWLGVSHADTEVKVGHPDTSAQKNAQILDRINAVRLYGVEFAAWVFGHYHSPRYQPRNPRVLWNGALIPPNGYARSEGHIGEPCGQWLWEAVPGHPIGDLRFLEVGVAQDHDEQLGRIIEPFRFSDE